MKTHRSADPAYRNGRTPALMLASMLLAGCTMAVGASEPATEIGVVVESNPVPTTAWEQFRASGLIGYVIIAAGLGSAAATVFGLRTLREERGSARAFTSDLEEALDTGGLPEALERCAEWDCALARIVEAGLARRELGPDRAQEAMEAQAHAENTQLAQRLGWVNLVAGTAPMLGLLGTVSGMIASFGQLAMHSTPNPQVLAGGIMVALMTTFFGLLVAIPSGIAFFILRQRMTDMTLFEGTVIGEITDAIRLDLPELAA